MATIGSLVVQTVTDYVLDYHVRKGMLLQSVQEKPLLNWLEQGKETFPGGKTNITTPVQGTLMNDTAGFFAGYTGDTALTFTQMALGDRAEYPWKEVHAGFVITHTQLAQDGIIVVDGENQTRQASQVDLIRLSGILQGAMQDFTESWATAKNSMLWDDGSQDSNQVPGIRALIVDDPTTGTVGGISQASSSWWRSRAKLDLAPSPENQDMSRFFRVEATQLKRYGGRPNKAFCGSEFWAALMSEVQAKGIYTDSGFASGKNDIGMDTISLKGVGTFEYDPTLDSKGLTKRCYIFDSRRLKLQPMEGSHNLTLNPARPYQYMVMLKSMIDRGGLTASQLNGMGAYGIA